MKSKSEISIRKSKPEDVEGQIKMWNIGIERKFFVYNGCNKKRTRKNIISWKKIIAANKKEEFNFVAIDNLKKIVVGFASFSGGKYRVRHRGELGWVVHPDYSGRGIATRLVDGVLKEAIRRGFKRAEAEVAVKNIPSIKIAKKLGFKIEGTKKKGILIDNGDYVDTYIFGKILK